MLKTALIICGPTASGKTEFAHYLAQIYRAEIINADSMQIYKQIPIITSSPIDKLKAEVSYSLYNFLDIQEEFSAIKYSELASKKIREIASKGILPIIVGGSGLYISTLVSGYNYIPPISSQIKDDTRNLYEEIGAIEFQKQLITFDPLIAGKINPFDKQRNLRAFEVIRQTGKSIFSFTEHNNFIPLPDFNFKILLLHPERKFLYENCNERVQLIINDAIEEIKNIHESLLTCNTSACKALGISEILSYLNRKIEYHELIDQISQNTRRYAKRQVTWFKNQFPNKEIIEYQDQSEFKNKLQKLNTVFSSIV